MKKLRNWKDPNNGCVFNDWGPVPLVGIRRIDTSLHRWYSLVVFGRMIHLN